MKTDNKKTGNRGEELASEFLESKGYLIVERNFRTRFGEVDIVCFEGEILIFVEVKTKIGNIFGEPEDMVSKSKLAQVRRMGEVFIELKKQETQSAQKSCSRVPDSGKPRMDMTARDFLSHSSVSDFLIRKWNGRCRVDVVAIVLNIDLSVERISHHEAVY